MIYSVNSKHMQIGLERQQANHPVHNDQSNTTDI